MNTEELRNNAWFKELPLIAILRGVEPSEVLDIANVLIDNGFRFIEVPLNSPDAVLSIKMLVEAYGEQAVIGAGTVTNIDKLMPVLEAGARLIVTPNMNPEVIRAARAHNCVVFSGVQTATEAFTAVDCGVTALKFFPAELIQPLGVKAIKSVLPPEMICCPTGGIEADAEQMKSYVDVGVDGFGLGSGLYKKGIKPSELSVRAKAYRDSWMSI
ncbi:2-dehydro-3-deoxy-6-phosphogalactonate aldolase [Photobacterium sanguinicancri]|uniref:2-dehydro-3-deoxy-6-phosphogalactonate aldolase n=1 Tax=Photobacterium sanguinicancri TaxID=875932 RepID=A0ABX4G359_9GAMM|nr:2-dehydro-3-deoxy-6-phosphogalactonate aldolase [Photobacterium sanguinicancri]KXI21277.1 2-dehydro-3-deoxy-6-phosphogalactonate aldolase [Photobacterium sanguinicancri]OZS45486.1 2-dehydro-3-deoxy-6-phosphogalactonate aldolase [Photobacterium sanguinicancri]